MTSRLLRPVFLIGFMGAGKTTVARRLARTCKVASLDIDTYLERREHKSVKELFREKGEEGFRCLETSVLREVIGKGPLIVSCGGGVVMRAENRALISDAGFVVYLKVDADEARARINDISSRPLFQDVDTARQTAMKRAPLYMQMADAVIDTTRKSVTVITQEVKTILEREGILCLQQR